MRYMPSLILIAFAATSAPLFADDGAGTVRNGTASKQPEMSRVPPHSSRLRFRSAGPVCMCGPGLSEAQISAAEHVRGQANSTAQKIIGKQ